MSSSSLLEVLLIEDNPGDAYLTLDALEGARVKSAVDVVGNGEDALRYLRREAPDFTHARRPDVILLDLNLPRKDGHEVLESIRADPSMDQLPVIVLTSSDREADIKRAYSLRANCYVTKPIRVDDFQQTLRTLADFWFTVVTLPRA